MQIFIIVLLMAILFLVIFACQIFILQKDVRKLNNISKYLLEEIKQIKGKNDE
mgnify:CR=1 FL=1